MSDSPKPTGKKRKQRKANAPPAPSRQGPPPVATPGVASDFDRCELYLNRELSLLEFQFRVLEEAEDERNPLLERVKFLAILGSNLDEFFMVRVAGLKQQIAAGVFEPSADGMTPSEQLAAVRKAATRLMTGVYRCLGEKLLPALSAAGIHILGWKALTKRQQQTVKRYFDDVVFPVLTPLAHDPGRPFPHISNLSLNLAVLLRGADGETRFARIKVPDTLPRLVPIKRSSGGTRKDGTVPQEHYFVWLEQVIAANLDALFPGVTILDAHPFRVTRNADIDIQDLEAADLLETIEESLQRRKFGTVVRLSTERGMPGEMREILFENLEVDRKDVYLLDGPLGLSALFQVAAIPLPNLKDRPYVPVLPPALEDSERDGDLFAPIRREDILLHHPFDSFAPVVDFLRRSSRDKDVLATNDSFTESARRPG